MMPVAVATVIGFVNLVSAIISNMDPNFLAVSEGLVCFIATSFSVYLLILTVDSLMYYKTYVSGWFHICAN